MKLSVTWNLHLASSANKMEHPFTTSTRRKKHREGIMLRLGNAVRNEKHAPLYTVTLTRIGRQLLDDHDNIRHAFKGVADGVCKILGIKNDNDKKVVKWIYAQEKGAPAIRVEVEC